jgi:LysM repeat protein
LLRLIRIILWHDLLSSGVVLRHWHVALCCPKRLSSLRRESVGRTEGAAFSDRKKPRQPAAAIYHYERFLKLQPNSSAAELARGHIVTCKLELAKTVSSLGPLPPSTQREMEKVLLENKDLKTQLARWEAAYAGRPQPQSPTNLPVQNSTRPAPEPAGTGQSATAQPSPAATNRPTSPATVRTHTVKAGENPAAIARKYGISTGALMAANPQARPTHLQVGQILNLPAP